MTILEILYNAQINLTDNIDTLIGKTLGQQQLKNAITLFEKGYSPEDDFDDIMNEYSSVEEVPNK